MTPYQQLIHKTRYAKWIPDQKRRESWTETCDRLIDFYKFHVESKLGSIAYSHIPWDELRLAIINMDVMPSMRAMMTAGPALERDNVAAFNCSYLPIDHPRAFDEIMYILMCGTGVGFSVERQYISQLPEVAEEFHDTETVIVVPDSRIGWASSLREFITLLYNGRIPKWDLSRVRPAGTRLKTFGGRASGPEPLDRVFRKIVEIFRKSTGRKLNSLECHDIVCQIADAVIVGGVRRSALISLSDLSDDRMRNAKNYNWWEHNAQRALANNSVAYTEKPDVATFLREWAVLYESRSGERGLFNRVAAKRQARRTERRDDNYEFGTNPCGEIILRPYEFCNLSEVIIRPNDTFDDIKRKVKIATIFGTIQSTFTDFRYLRPIWKRNCEEERLLGVSFTGIMDHPVMSGQQWGILGFDYYEGNLTYVLQNFKEYSIEVNKQFSEVLGINQSAAITCIKPSGTVSQLCNTSWGIHPRHSKYYLRSIRMDNKDAVVDFLKQQGVPWEPEVNHPNEMTVFYFPMEAPEGAVLNKSISAINQLNLYRTYYLNWCEHNPSVSIYVSENEWLSVAEWVYNNFEDCNGISFFPKDNHIYEQAPFKEISAEEFERLAKNFPDIEWEQFEEIDDTSTGYQELACTAGQCEI